MSSGTVGRAGEQPAKRCHVHFAASELIVEAHPEQARLKGIRQAEATQCKQITGGPRSRQFVEPPLKLFRLIHIGTNAVGLKLDGTYGFRGR
jgi:hypothetical protein